MNLSLFATACSGLRIEFYQVVLLAGELGGVTAVVHDLAANNYLVTYLYLRVALNPRLIAEVLAAIGDELLATSSTIVRDVEGSCSILGTEGELDAADLTLDIVVSIRGLATLHSCYDIIGLRSGERTLQCAGTAVAASAASTAISADIGIHHFNLIVV